MTFKKRFTVLTAVVLCLVMSVALVGCGGDGKKTDPVKYAVTYSAGDGATGTAPASAEYESGATFTLPEATGLEKDGYTFDKWYDGSADYAAGATYTMPAKAVNFTATWKADETDTPAPSSKYTVAYHVGEGVTGTAPASAEYESGATFRLPEATGLEKEGYTFDKWYDGAADYAPGAAYTMPAKAVNFTAKWKSDSSEPTHRHSYGAWKLATYSEYDSESDSYSAHVSATKSCSGKAEHGCEDIKLTDLPEVTAAGTGYTVKGSAPVRTYIYANDNGNLSFNVLTLSAASATTVTTFANSTAVAFLSGEEGKSYSVAAYEGENTEPTKSVTLKHGMFGTNPLFVDSYDPTDTAVFVTTSSEVQNVKFTVTELPGANVGTAAQMTLGTAVTVNCYDAWEIASYAKIELQPGTYQVSSDNPEMIYQFGEVGEFGDFEDLYDSYNDAGVITVETAGTYYFAVYGALGTTETFTVAAHSHNYGAWEVTEMPTPYATGTATKTCSLSSSHTVEVALPRISESSYDSFTYDSTAHSVALVLNHDLGNVSFTFENYYQISVGDSIFIPKLTNKYVYLEVMGDSDGETTYTFTATTGDSGANQRRIMFGSGRTFYNSPAEEVVYLGEVWTVSADNDTTEFQDVTGTLSAPEEEPDDGTITGAGTYVVKDADFWGVVRVMVVDPGKTFTVTAGADCEILWGTQYEGGEIADSYDNDPITDSRTFTEGTYYLLVTYIGDGATGDVEFTVTVA